MPKSWGEHHQTTEIGIFLGFMACGKKKHRPQTWDARMDPIEVNREQNSILNFECLMLIFEETNQQQMGIDLWKWHLTPLKMPNTCKWSCLASHQTWPTHNHCTGRGGKHGVFSFVDHMCVFCGLQTRLYPDSDCFLSATMSIYESYPPTGPAVGEVLWASEWLEKTVRAPDLVRNHDVRSKNGDGELGNHAMISYRNYSGLPVPLNEPNQWEKKTQFFGPQLMVLNTESNLVLLWMWCPPLRFVGW